MYETYNMKKTLRFELFTKKENEYVKIGTMVYECNTKNNSGIKIEADITTLLSLFKEDNEVSKTPISDEEQSIYQLVHNAYSGRTISPDELYNLIKYNNIDISKHRLGIILKKRFSQIIKRSGKTVNRMYIIP